MAVSSSSRSLRSARAGLCAAAAFVPLVVFVGCADSKCKCGVIGAPEDANAPASSDDASFASGDSSATEGEADASADGAGSPREGGLASKTDASSGGGPRDGSLDAACESASCAPCTHDTDCSAPQRCGFPRADGCAAIGQCVTPTVFRCNLVHYACGCDGALVEDACTGLPDPFTVAPLSGSASCFDAGAADAD